MPSMVYAPEVTIRILSQKARSVIDLSEDIVSGSVTRDLGPSVSTMNVTLLNAGRKYDGMFSPMDSVVVYLRRIKPMLVFSGYLDEVPIFSALPGNINLRASCTLKRLQHFYWDPNAPASVQLFGTQSVNGRSDLNDGGLALRTIDLLNKVAGWSKDQIHIAGVPANWFDKVSKLADEMVASSEAATLAAVVGSDAYLNGSSPSVGKYSKIPGIGEGTGELPYTRGKISYFGGVGTSDATGQMALTGESGTNPRDDWYCAMRWPYVYEDLSSRPGVNVSQAKQWWANRRILVVNPKNNKAVVLRAADWGPNISTGRVIDVSKAAMRALGAGTDDTVSIAFAERSGKSARLGPVRASGLGEILDTRGVGGSISSDPTAVTSGWGRHGDVGNQVMASAAGIRFQCHKLAKEKFEGFVTDLVEELGYHPRSIGGYNNRQIAGSSTWSNHAWGAAIDIDPTRNPLYSGKAILDGTYALPKPPRIIQLARKWGLGWGGEWNNTKDYMHFEVIGAPSSDSYDGVKGGSLIVEKWLPPVAKPYRVSAKFGDGGSSWANGHTGTDFAVPSGTKIMPVGPGTVESKGFDGSYGNYISINHGKGVYTFYGHMQAPTSLDLGDLVGRNTRLGGVGSTGNATGPHVHLELRLNQDSYAAAKASGGIEKYILGGPSRPDPPNGVGGFTDDSSASGGGMDLSNIGGALFNVYQWYANAASEAGNLLTGYRALMNDVPVLGTVDEYMSTGLRDYSSAPNGDFIGWFPDYFGHYKQAGKMVVTPLEIDGVSGPPTIGWSDASLKTHQFAVGAMNGLSNDASSLIPMLTTAGIASVEFPELVHALLNVSREEADALSRTFLLRYGARPETKYMNQISGPRQEFFFACMEFMRNWSQQFQSTINLMFMPEVYPGMLLCVPFYGMQGYVRSVTHTFDLNGGGFQTSVSAAPWSTIGKNGPKGLPRGAPL